VRGGGFIEGYNAQNVASQDELITATRLTQDTTDTAWFEPMLGQAEQAAAFITARQPGRGWRRADRAVPGRRRLPVRAQPDHSRPGPADRRRQNPRPGENRPRHHPRTGHSAAIAAMAARLATAEGITAYRQRSHIAETPHGQVKHNTRFRQLSLRGHAKAAAEWAFTCAVHNLFKAITAGHLTTTALAGLPAQPGQAGP
jgi:hypothetical protein